MFDVTDVLVCERCGRTTLRRSPVQIYCTTCSAELDRARKDPGATRRRSNAERTKRRKEIGAETSKANAAPLAWVTDSHPELQRLVRVRVPFNRRFSKNALWSSDSRGHVFMRQEIKAVRDELVVALRGAGGEWFEGKVWIDIFVEKPNAKSDAINVVDLVCDAVKQAIGIDDRWFSIRRLDWSIVKTNPQILVGVGQDISEHHRACASCGNILPLTSFSRNRSDRLGRSRECQACRHSLREEPSSKRSASKGGT